MVEEVGTKRTTQQILCQANTGIVEKDGSGQEGCVLHI